MSPENDVEEILTMKWWLPNVEGHVESPCLTLGDEPVMVHGCHNHYLHCIPVSIYNRVIATGFAMIDVNKCDTSQNGYADRCGVRTLYRVPILKTLGRSRVRAGIQKGKNEERLVFCFGYDYAQCDSWYSIFWESAFSPGEHRKLTFTFTPQLQHLVKEYATWEQHHTGTTTTDCSIHVSDSFGGNPFRVLSPSESTHKPASGE